MENYTVVYQRKFREGGKEGEEARGSNNERFEKRVKRLCGKERMFWEEEGGGREEKGRRRAAGMKAWIFNARSHNMHAWARTEKDCSAPFSGPWGNTDLHCCITLLCSSTFID